MISINLKQYVNKEKISINKLSKVTGITRPTLTNMYNGKATGIQFDTLEVLCSYFSIQLSDLLTQLISKNDIGITFVADTPNKSKSIFSFSYTRHFKTETITKKALFSCSFSDTRNLDNKDYLTNFAFSQKNTQLPDYNFAIDLFSSDEINELQKRQIIPTTSSDQFFSYNETLQLFRSFSSNTQAYISGEIIAAFFAHFKVQLNAKRHYLINVQWLMGLLTGEESAFNFTVNNDKILASQLPKHAGIELIGL